MGGGGSWAAVGPAIVAEESISDSDKVPKAFSDDEEEARVAAGADLRRGVAFGFDDLLAAGRGGLKAGRARFAGRSSPVVGIAVVRSGSE